MLSPSLRMQKKMRVPPWDIMVRLHPDLVENDLSYFTNKTFVVCTQKNRIVMVLLTTHSKCCNRRTRKLFTVHAKTYAHLDLGI